MHFHFDSATTVDSILYSSAAPGGGVEPRSLEVQRLPCTGLVPPGLDALLLTSDLQGVAPLASLGGAVALLGEALVEWFVAASELDEVPLPARVGVVIAGDMFSDPRARERGATGDVGPVWAAFAREFAWVAGVAGNHDLFTSRTARHALRHDHVALLDGEVVAFHELRIGGVGGIIGRKGKPNRRPEPAFLDALRRTLAERPDVVVLHEGPPGPSPKQRGRQELLAPLTKAGVPLVLAGHAHWSAPHAQLGATQVLNLDGRAILAVPAEPVGAAGDVSHGTGDVQ